jgi:hypothetical protein
MMCPHACDVRRSNYFPVSSGSKALHKVIASASISAKQ